MWILTHWQGKIFVYAHLSVFIGIVTEIDICAQKWEGIREDFLLQTILKNISSS